MGVTVTEIQASAIRNLDRNGSSRTDEDDISGGAPA